MNDLKGGRDRCIEGHRRGHRQSLSAAGAAVVVNYAFSKEDADRVIADIKRTAARPLLSKAT
jgi:hypothetical protein